MLREFPNEGTGHLPVYLRFIILVEQPGNDRHLPRFQSDGHIVGKAHQFDGENSLRIEIRCIRSPVAGLVSAPQTLQYPRILRLSGGPPGEALLIGAFLSERTKAFQSEALTLPFFPGIGYVGRLGGVLYPYRRVGAMAALIMSSRSVRIRILFGFDAMTRATWSDVTYSRVEPGQP